MHNSFHMQDILHQSLFTATRKKEVFISLKLKSFGLKVFFAKVLNYSYLFIFCVKAQVFVIAESQALLFNKITKFVIYLFGTVPFKQYFHNFNTSILINFIHSKWILIGPRMNYWRLIMSFHKHFLLKILLEFIQMYCKS